MTALSTFITSISSEINKGTTFDSSIAKRVQMAGRRLEQNYKWKYMETLTTATIAANTSYIAQPSLLRSVEWFRFTDTDGNYSFLPQVDAEQVLSLDTATPNGFWLATEKFVTSNIGRIYFDVLSTADIALDVMYSLYSDWVNSSDFWLLQNCESLLLAETMIMMAPLCREPKWPEFYKQMRDEGERVALLADQELRHSARDMTMIYKNRGAS